MTQKEKSKMMKNFLGISLKNEIVNFALLDEKNREKQIETGAGKSFQTQSIVRIAEPAGQPTRYVWE